MHPRTQGDSDPQPEPPSRLNKEIKELLEKVEHPHELIEYVKHLAFYDAAHLVDTIKILKHRLLMQGLEENDLHTLHSFLYIAFDGDIMQSRDSDLTKVRAGLLERHFGTS